MLSILLAMSMALPHERTKCGVQDGGAWVRNSDYPRKALRQQLEGTVEFTLDVNAHGCPTRCVVTRSSNVPILDEATCRLLMRRARFGPAEKDGKRVPATYSNHFTWSFG